MHSQLRFLFFHKKSMYALELVNPKVGRIMTMKRRYQNVFFMMAWFCPDLVQCPTSKSAYATTTGRRAVNVQIISVGRKSVSQAGSSLKLSNGSVTLNALGVGVGLLVRFFRELMIGSS